MPLDRLPRVAYERELTENKTHLNWAMGIKNTLEQTGFAYVWINGTVNNINSFTMKFKQRLRDMYQQTWSDKCNRNDKFSCYRSFKPMFGMEKYLVDISIAKFRMAFARIRTSTSYLHINRTFIYPNADTKCPFCDKIEDELHFLKDCAMYKDCLLYTSPSPRDLSTSRMPSSA